ncbi:T9SS C-terminal target domain-containing protein [Pontibacter diazotrophicus]|uniref:T9SS C-terminal target domain-containing protein n=1 Tax=Pontibacter diazotrophicus TaxID=1400979 RepID=A0A3D8LDR8_9BACT|nr:T9SS type A sorting domain-containing protein [Pontibacter diazotrophicus]RDV15609.1 T9SS C-terminal target domain-containing protein [Pontibacter diazotrophicus]
MNLSRNKPRQTQRMHWLCFLTVLGLLLLGLEGYGQSRMALGAWQVHVPYQQGKAVADARDKVYVAADNGLFYYDKEFNTTETITKVDGLREQQISTIGYDVETSTLVIAYANTQVDLLRDNIIYNISDIFRKPTAGEKEINHIFIHNKLAYLSGSFGVVALDLQKREIKDTYSNLGPGGEAVQVQASAILRDSIYLVTNLGLLAAQHTGTNLQDFHNWSGLNNGLPTPETVTSLAAFNNRLYAGTAASGVYSLTAGSWQPAAVAPNTAINTITASNNYLTVATAAGVYLLDQQNNISHLTHQLLEQPQQAIAGADGLVWAADRTNGFVRLTIDGNAAAAFAPDGPYSGNSFRVYTHAGKAYVLSGGFNEGYSEAGIQDGFFVHENGEWTSYNQFLYPNPQEYVPARDLVAATYNPVTDKMYFGSYGDGLVEWGGPGNTLRYNNSNSTLVSNSPDAAANAVRVTDMDVDAAGNVWVVNRHQLSGAPGLHVLQPDGTWKSFLLPGVADGSNLDLIQVDDYNQKWLSVSRRGNTSSGLVVFDETQNRVRQLRAGEGNGGLPDGAVYSMAKDLNGDIWVGTASGVGVYYNPGFVFETQPYDAHIPVIDRRPLLNGQIVRSISVDGANRKWMGTDHGLWLFSPDGDAVIHHFTTQNSPLPSDKVLSVAVEHKTGEVFIATEAGVASYRAGATITEGEPECATVFPNPVRRDYTGLVGVSGLPNNADVRITDISGTLVYKTKALGGTLNWDARDYNGKRVKAGVYLVMSSGAEGGQTCISKIAVLE